MQTNEQKKKTETEILKEEQITFLIPQCCREGWDSCKHTPQKQKKVKQNIGL